MVIPTLNLEKKLWKNGYSNVCGIDEVGRGCFAGPVVTGAVIFPKDFQMIDGLADSKLLKPRQRERLSVEIKKQALVRQHKWLSVIRNMVLPNIKVMGQNYIRKQLKSMVYQESTENHLIWIDFSDLSFWMHFVYQNDIIVEMSTVNIGNKGEELACEYLKKQGYKILKRNYRIRGGEIDIVAKDGNALVFVEVKTRWSHEYGFPVESMTFWKIKALLKTAKFYVQKIGWNDKEYRLDFVGIDFADNKDDPTIELIKNIIS